MCNDGGTQGEKLNLCGDLVNNTYIKVCQNIEVCMFVFLFRKTKSRQSQRILLHNSHYFS